MLSGRSALIGAWSAAVAALALLTAAEIWLAPGFGWWLDEIFSLWASDPTLSAGESIARVTGDSNPPLYFALLRLVRGLLTNPRAAVMASSAITMAATAAFVIWTSWRAGALAWGLGALAAFTLSGTTFFFFQEARAYFLGTCIAFAASWQVALMIAAPDGPRRPVWLMALGVIGSLTHFYAGLVVGCLAAGMLGYGWFARRRDLLMPALVMGAAAAISFLIWFATAADRVSNISWIAFTPGSVRAAVWYARALALGPAWMLAPLVILLGFAVRLKDARPILIVFAATSALFIALPLAISFITPLIMGRYWAIGAPLVVVLLVSCARAFAMRPEIRERAGALGAAGFLALSSIFGLNSAKYFLEIEPVWDGAPVVSALVGDCPPGAVRVPNLAKIYATAADAREEIFTVAEGASPIAMNAARCPVIGWAEHVQHGDNYSLTAPDADLLAIIGVAAAPGGYRIVRHDSGFVVLAPDAPAQP